MLSKIRKLKHIITMYKLLFYKYLFISSMINIIIYIYIYIYICYKVKVVDISINVIYI